MKVTEQNTDQILKFRKAISEIFGDQLAQEFWTEYMENQDIVDNLKDKLAKIEDYVNRMGDMECWDMEWVFEKTIKDLKEILK